MRPPRRQPHIRRQRLSQRRAVRRHGAHRAIRRGGHRRRTGRPGGRLPPGQAAARLRDPRRLRAGGRRVADALGGPAPLHAWAPQRPAGNAVPGRPAWLPDQGRGRRLPRGLRDPMELPVRTGVRVTDVWPDDEPRISDSDRRRRLRSRRRSSSRPVPTIGPASRTSPTSSTRRSRSCTRASSRSTSQLRDGTVLVVGASNSGAEIALMAAREHRTVLVGPRRRQDAVPPRGSAGPDLRHRVLVLRQPHRHASTRRSVARRTPASVITVCPSTASGHRTSAPAASNGSTPRTVGARDGMPLLDDGRVIDAANVVWATGFRPDHRLDPPPGDRARRLAASDPRRRDRCAGAVLHRPPVHVCGASSLLGGVGRDAAYLVDQMARQAADRRSSSDQETAIAS